MRWVRVEDKIPPSEGVSEPDGSATTAQEMSSAEAVAAFRVDLSSGARAGRVPVAAAIQLSGRARPMRGRPRTR